MERFCLPSVNVPVILPCVARKLFSVLPIKRKSDSETQLSEGRAVERTTFSVNLLYKASFLFRI